VACVREEGVQGGWKQQTGPPCKLHTRVQPSASVIQSQLTTLLSSVIHCEQASAHAGVRCMNLRHAVVARYWLHVACCSRSLELRRLHAEFLELGIPLQQALNRSRGAPEFAVGSAHDRRHCAMAVSEADVGIRAWTNDLKGFTGILKQRCEFLEFALTACLHPKTPRRGMCMWTPSDHEHLTCAAGTRTLRSMS